MKKVLLAFMAILLVASMFALMASCGKSTATTNENTSGTSALTTGAVPDNKLPDNTDYSKKAGSRFEFVISAEGYFATDYNAQGNPLVRRIYEFETMVLPSDHVFFAYEYDAKGVLKGYSFRNYHFTEAQALTMTYDENGRAVFEGEYKDVKQVYSEDLQTEIALYKGQTVQVEHTTTVPSTSATTPATSRPPKTTKPATGTSRPETQPTTTQTYYVGAGTTGAEENMVMLNAILDEGAMAAFGLAGSEFDTGARLLISREVYNRLAEQGNGLPVMMSVFSHSRTLENKDMFAVLNQQPEPYDSYVVRLPRPKNTEEHNRFYVLDMSGDTVGDYVEAVAEPEYVQVTLPNLNAVALVACEATVSQSNWRVHPLVYVFFILGGLLLLVAATMIYFFFLYRPQTADGPAKQVVYDFTDEIEDEAADTADFNDEIPFDNMPEMDDLGDDIPEEDIEESISLGDLFNRRDE